jgi:hypothetical protein
VEDYTPLIRELRQRLDLAEAQLALLSERAGVPYQRPGDEVPPHVRQLVADGRRLDAIRELRAGGISMDDAKAIVERMWPVDQPRFGPTGIDIPWIRARAWSALACVILASRDIA